MTPAELSRTVLGAVRRAVGDGVLAVEVPARVVLARPGAGGRGDYATGVALQLAGPAGVPARRVAEILRERLLAAPGVDRVDITGAGFLNITLAGEPGATDAALVGEVLREGRSYGHVAHVPGRVGGSVHLRVAPGIRAAVVADSAARLLRSQGATVSVGETDADVGPSATGPDTGADTRIHAAPSDSRSAASDAPRSAAPRSAAPRPAAVARVVPVRPVPVPPTADPVALLGPDAARWALLHPAPQHRVDLSAETHLTQRESNPLFLVRYAHSRAEALVRNAADLGFSSVPGDTGVSAQSTMRITDTTSTMIRIPPAALATPPTALPAVLADYPAVLAAAARHAAPDRLARYLVRGADALLRFTETYRILPFGDEKPSAAHRARLALAEAAGTVLAGGLDLLGIEAPVFV